MDKDFHYYATYAAALTAGWDTDKAVTIAQSAQYVDDCVPKLLKGTYKRGDKEYGIISTCCGTMDSIFMSELGTNVMWMSFHFLPGNFKAREDKDANQRNYLKYYGERDSSGKFNEDAFLLLNIPKSYLSQQMINDCIGKENEDYYLDMVGLRAHVLADTVAHAFYSGQAERCVNEVGSDIYDVYNGKETKILFDPFHEWCAPDVIYLGHGRAGHIPDYAYCNYKYIPQWNTKKDENIVYIKHKETYEFAFKILVQALYCIRTGTEFSFGREYTSYKYRDKPVLPKISERLQKHIGFYHEQSDYDKNVDRRCEGYNDIFKELGMKELASYNAKNFSGKRFEYFNYAALKHFMLVRDTIQNNGFRTFDELKDIKDETKISMILSKEYKNAKNKMEQSKEISGEMNAVNNKEKVINKDIAGGKIDPVIDKFFEFFW